MKALRLPRDEPAMRAAPSRGQFNKRAQSNQQDLIGQMETNRQQQPARGQGALLAADAGQRKPRIEQRGEECLERGNQRVTHHSVRRNERAPFPLAVLRPVMRMVRSLTGALTVRGSVTVSRQWAIPAVAGVRMVRAAPHHQVNYQRRGDQDATQPGHKIFRLPRIRYRRRNLTILNRAHQPPSLVGTTIQPIFVIVSCEVWASQLHLCCDLCCDPPPGGATLGRLKGSGVSTTGPGQVALCLVSIHPRHESRTAALRNRLASSSSRNSFFFGS